MTWCIACCSQGDAVEMFCNDLLWSLTREMNSIIYKGLAQEKWIQLFTRESHKRNEFNYLLGTRTREMNSIIY